MKIINAVYGDATGGRWKAMLNIADTLKSYGHEVILLRGNENSHLENLERPIEVVNCRGFYSITGALRLRKFIKQFKPDLIIVHSGKAVWSFKNAMIGMKKKIPVIAVNHSHNVKRTIRADAFIHITPHVKSLVNALQNENDKKNKPESIISNLLELPLVSAEPREIRNPASIVMITRMTDIKGIHILIKAISLLKEKDIYIKVILAGEGESKAEYEDLVASLELQDRISFPGWVNGEAKNNLYNHADFVAVPSLYDVQPLGILDAFGWGKVVISSDHIGPMQICKHNENAWVTKAGDPVDLANGIEYLLNNSEVALSLAKNAKREAVEKYSFEQIAKEHNEFIHRVYHFYS